METRFKKLYWGFFFILISFKFNGFDIFPDIIGFILFALALNSFPIDNTNFSKAKKLNIIMLVLSIFSIYSPSIQLNHFNFNPYAIPIIAIGIASTIVRILLIYYLLMGIKDLCEEHRAMDLYDEVETRWKQFLYLQLGLLLSFIIVFIPLLGIIYFFTLFILNIAFAIAIMGLMKKCDMIIG